MIRQLKSLLDDRRGAAVIEMAFVTPILAAMVVGIIDLSGAYSKKLQLEQAAQRTIEKAQQTLVDEDFLNTLQAEAAQAANVPTSNVVIDFWRECNGTRQGTYQSNCSPGVPQARYVKVDVRDNFTPMFGFRFAGANANGSYTLHGISGLRVQ